MPIYFHERVTAEHRDVVERKKTCVRCGARTTIKVLARGRGEGRSPYLLTPDDALRDARDDAVYAAGHDADRVSSLCRCPRCERRDAGAWILFWCMVLLRLGTLGAVAAVSMLVARASTAAVIGLTVAVAAMQYAFSEHGKWWGLERRVLSVNRERAHSNLQPQAKQKSGISRR